MIDVLNFIFSSFWHFIGSVILILTIGEAIGAMWKR